MTASAWNDKAVVVTRDEPEQGPLCSGLRELGLRVLLWPVMRIRPPDDLTALESALANLHQYDWIVFASQHAVSAVTARVASPPLHLRVAAVGQRTADALRAKRWRVEVVSRESTAAGLVTALGPFIEPRTRVLFPASSRALPTLPTGLAKHGATVHQVEAYCAEAASLDVEECRTWVEREAIGAVTFTSPSAVHELQRALGDDWFRELLSHSTAIALGPTTGQALAERGFKPVLAQPSTLSGLAATTFRLMQTR